jgi:hypothetical protein
MTAMVHDESSFDITAAPGIRIPPDYRRMRMVGGRQGDPLAGGQGRHIAESIPH